VVPAADTTVVRRLLELSHHRFSPNGVGATLVYQLTEHPDAGHQRDAGIDVSPLNLSVLNESDEPLLLHQAKYRDGALLVAHEGSLRAVNVILRPTLVSEQAVAATKGTRHTSAARHTYDCPDVLAFVVSTDGPVTVFSDGRRIADLRHAPPKTPTRIDELVVARRAGRNVM
jgi:DNA integrity scanning protein DisA with diadenylate cyclase activity